MSEREKGVLFSLRPQWSLFPENFQINKKETEKKFELEKLKKEISLKIFPGLFSLTIEEDMKKTKGKMELCSLRKESKKFKRRNYI